MPHYNYIAKVSPDKTIQGEIEADSQSDALVKLSNLGYFPLSLKPVEQTLNKKNFWLLRKISRREVALFTSQLCNLLGSGVHILNSLEIISRQTANKYFKSVINDIVSRVKDGKSLSASLSFYPDVFPGLYVPVIHSGEVGGKIEESLERLSNFLEKEEEFKNSLRAALTYPFFIVIVGISTIIVLLTFVIPRLTLMFQDLGQALPLPTRILMDFSAFLRAWWWLFLAVPAVLIFGFRRLKQIPEQRLLWDRFKLRIYLFGELILKGEISRLMHTLALLLSSGITITSALEISIAVVENAALKSELEKFNEQIKNGSSLSRCLNESKFFPGFVTNIVAVGEETGSLEKSLERISLDYEKDVDRKIKAVTRMLEPVIILVMGLIVGFIVLSMLLPIFQINLMAR